MVRALVAEGVERIFAVPGEENVDLLEALRESPIRVIVARHEQAAGFMAAAEGRLRGRAGVCLSTLGPGATNLVTAAAHAQLGAMPMVMITGQKPIRQSEQAAFQLIDVVDMMQPLTKFSESLVAAQAIPHGVREAFRQAEEERPGAAHLELPEDVAQERVTGEPVAKPTTRRPVAEDRMIAQAARWIREARRPLLLIGGGANRKRCSRSLTDFVERLGIPFVTTQLGKGVVSEHREECLGTAALSSDDLVHVAFECADLVINAGYDPVEKPPFLMRDGDSRRLIHVDFSAPRAEPVYKPGLEVVGDIASAIERITQTLAADPRRELGAFRPVRDAWLETLAEPCAPDESGPRSLAAALERELPERTRIVLDNGMYKIWFARNYRVREPNQMILDNALATMGAGLPGAMASRIVEPERPVVAVCGDGGFLMNAQELETAGRLGLDLVVLVLVDRAYGMIRWKQASMGLPDFGLDFGNPDFVRFAEAHGVRGHHVADHARLAAGVVEALDEGGVHLFEVPVAYERDNERLDREYPRRAERLRASE
jgi:acetolactate synthase-1/2/3 large subunit